MSLRDQILDLRRSQEDDMSRESMRWNEREECCDVDGMEILGTTLEALEGQKQIGSRPCELNVTIEGDVEVRKARIDFGARNLTRRT